MFKLRTLSPNLRGIVSMLLAMLIFTIVNAVIKDGLSGYPAIQITFFRNLGVLIPVSLIAYKAHGRQGLQTTQLPHFFLCGVVGVAALTCLFTALKLLPLADVTCITFANILFVTLFAGIFLKETVTLYQWLAIGAGFIAVVIIAKPGAGVLSPAALYALGFAILDGFMMLSMRLLSRKDSPLTIVFYFALFAALISGAISYFYWTPITFADLSLFALLGLGGGLGQYFLTYAYEQTRAVIVAPVIYSSLIWSALLGYFLWGDIPSPRLWLGAGIMVAAGIVLTLTARDSSLPDKTK